MIVDLRTRIEPASSAEVDAVLRLLDQNHLPLDGLEDHLADVPPTVQTSVEFTSACPSSATVMRKSL